MLSTTLALSTLVCARLLAWPTVYPTGVTLYKPDKCSGGYLLEFHHRRIPMLMDMNGKVVHAWPKARGIGRMRLLPNGNLVYISLGASEAPDLPPGQDEPRLVEQKQRSSLVEVDWEGNKVWEFTPPGRPHHDFQRLTNGNTLMIYAEPVPAERRPKAALPERRNIDMTSDVILEVNPKGETVWEWHECDHLDIDVYSSRDGLRDWTHTNTVQALPPNKWYDSGDERFKPGNVLISVRNHDAILIIDKETKEIVWRYSGDYKGGLAHQHEPHMIEPGLPGEGNIIIFDNGYASRSVAHDGRTFILEINPVTKKIAWKYEKGHDFYSATAGVQQRLPNGNTMITSSCERRVFEVTPEGEVVWEWVPDGYNPMRPNRYPYDYCPQLKAMGVPAETPVVLSVQRSPILIP